MKAILLAGVTSIQSFPVRTTGPIKVRTGGCIQHTRLFALLTTFLYALENMSNHFHYFWLAFVCIDNCNSTSQLVYEPEQMSYLVFLSDMMVVQVGD